MLFANAAGDELSILAAEVKNDHAAKLGIRALLLLLLHLRSAGHCPPLIDRESKQRKSACLKALVPDFS